MCTDVLFESMGYSNNIFDKYKKSTKVSFLHYTYCIALTYQQLFTFNQLLTIIGHYCGSRQHHYSAYLNVFAIKKTRKKMTFGIFLYTIW